MISRLFGERSSTDLSIKMLIKSKGAALSAAPFRLPHHHPEKLVLADEVAEGGAGVVRGLDGPCGDLGAAEDGFAEREAPGQAHDGAREEGVAGAADVQGLDRQGGLAAGVAGAGVVEEGAVCAQGHHHHPEAGLMDELLKQEEHVVVLHAAKRGAQQLLGVHIIAYEALQRLQKARIGPDDLQVAGNAEDRYGGLPGPFQGLKRDLPAQVQLQHQVGVVGEDLGASAVQELGQVGEVRHLGDGAFQRTRVVDDGQPHAHAAFGGFDHIGNVDVGFLETGDDVAAEACGIHCADEADRHIHKGQVLGHIAGHASVRELDPSLVPARRAVRVTAEAFAIHKNCTDYSNGTGHEGISFW